jgi:hypothetical protein
MKSASNPKWYETPTGVSVLIILFFPVGLYLMWKNKIWSNSARWSLTILILLFALGYSQDETSTSKKASKEVVITEKDVPGTYNNFESNYQLRLASDGSLEFYTATSMVPQIGYWKLNNNVLTFGIPTWVSSEIVLRITPEGLYNDAGKLVWKKA